MFVFNKKSITFFFLFFLAYSFSNALISQEISPSEIFTKDKPPLSVKFLLDLNSTSERCAALYTAYSFATGTETKERARISENFISKAAPFNMFQAFVIEASKDTDWAVKVDMRKISDLTNFYNDLIRIDIRDKEIYLEGETRACDTTLSLIQPILNQMN